MTVSPWVREDNKILDNDPVVCCCLLEDGNKVYSSKRGVMRGLAGDGENKTVR